MPPRWLLVILAAKTSVQLERWEPRHWLIESFRFLGIRFFKAPHVSPQGPSSVNFFVDDEAATRNISTRWQLASPKRKHLMWVCRNVINHPLFDGWNPSHKNGDDWGMVYGIAIPTSKNHGCFASQPWTFKSSVCSKGTHSTPPPWSWEMSLAF